MNKSILTLFLIGLTCQIGICQTTGRKMLISTSSDKARELFQQGVDLKRNVEFAPGDKLLKQAIGLDPDFALAHCWLGTRESVDKALELIRFVTPAEGCAIRCWDAQLKNDWKLAERYADTLESLYPKDPGVLYDVATVYYQNDQAKSNKYLDRALAVDPGFLPAYNIKGYYYMEAGNFGEAEKMLRKYLDLRPKGANAHDSYAEFLVRTGKYAQAAEEYWKAYEYDPTTVDYMSKAGWSYIRQGMFGQARKIFGDFGQKATDNNNKLYAIFLQALTSFVEGNMKQAFADLDAMKVKATELKNPFFILNADSYKGVMLLESGNPAGAVKHLVVAGELIPTLGMKPDEASLANLYVHGFLAMAYAFNGKMDKAQKELDQASHIYNGLPGNAQNASFMAVFQSALEINRKNYPKAIELTEPRALQMGSVSNCYYTGLAYDRAGNAAKAIEFYTRTNEHMNPTFTAFYFNKTKDRIKQLKK